MAAKHYLEPDRDTPAPGTAWDAPDALPHTLLSEHLQRLAVCAAIGAGLWTYGVVMDTLVRPLTVGLPVATPSVVVELISVAASLAMFFYARYGSHDADRKADAGLAYVVLNAAGVAVINATTGLAA